MALPTFQSFFYPFLKFSSDKKEHSLKEVKTHLSNHFSLTAEERTEKVRSGTQTKFDNRIYWTRSYFIKAGLIKSSKRAHFTITKSGLEFLEQFKDSITTTNLKEIDAFRNFNSGTQAKKDLISENDQTELIETQSTPHESLENSFSVIQKQLAHELLEKTKSNTWQFFEDLVIELMVKMGYGGSRVTAREQLSRTNDEGIDGIINEDKLGLDVIYLQAKKWTKETSIGRPEIQKFVGALHGKRANKGVFITTGLFANTSYEYVKTIVPKVILIDGETLSNLMIEYSLGTTTMESYHVKKVDLDYFEGE
ncbi:MAG: restriction endonuclease [Flavobacteriales bacterium]|nr:restriction endonuclease [Flavobacteriales bacterium]